MVNHMRHTRSHTGNRRSHHALVEPRLSRCNDCNAPHRRHRACENCGKYQGRVAFNATATIAKKEKKKKEREKAAA